MRPIEAPIHFLHSEDSLLTPTPVERPDFPNFQGDANENSEDEMLKLYLDEIEAD